MFQKGDRVVVKRDRHLGVGVVTNPCAPTDHVSFKTGLPVGHYVTIRFPHLGKKDLGYEESSLERV